jgi:hypothetical protein
MQETSRFIFLLLKNTFIITVISLLLAWLGGDGSFFERVFGFIGFFGAILTIKLFFIHVLVLILAFLFKKNNSGT